MGIRKEYVVDLSNLFSIKENNWYKIISWAKIAYDEDKNEISGLATAVPDKDGNYIISDIEILKQENSGTNTELDADSVTNYKMKYGMKYKNPEMKFVWWHSHHTMEAFWSGTDEKEIEAWKNDSFSLALVVNLKQEYKFRVSIWKASGLSIEQHYDIPLNIIRKDGIKVTDSMKKQYEELCSERTYGVARNHTGYTYYRGNNVNQSQVNLWNHSFKNANNDKEALKDKSYYSEICEVIESYIHRFVSGELSLVKFKNKLKKIQSKMDGFKITDYKILIPEGNKENVLEEMQFIFPNDLLEFKDDKLKSSYEEEDYYGWYN